MWRPSIALCQQEALVVSRLELFYASKFSELASQVIADIKQVSPETDVVSHIIELKDLWDFEEVYGALFDFARTHKFDLEREEYLLHITTGTHVAQICMFLLAEARFFPAKLIQIGADKEAHSDFQLIAATNRELSQEVRRGVFREDLLSRINLWSFILPGLRERAEDIEPNLNYELEKFAQRHGSKAAFNKEARSKFLAFAASPAALWQANFRDLNAAVTRMAILAGQGRITEKIVDEEVARLCRQWSRGSLTDEDESNVFSNWGVAPKLIKELDLFDRLQLCEVLQVCSESASLSEAGRLLFSQSRKRRKSANDADRLRKYLARFEVAWSDKRTL